MSWSDVRLFIAILILAFLFAGEPDVWDMIHNKTMSMEACK